jgi:Type I phosphodiesterase / nucleotide pyrophosphatase
MAFILLGLREECTEATFCEALFLINRRTVSVVILLADGARPDTLAAALDSGALPALARLRADGGLHTVTTCFPSVTGPAYAPFLLGRLPGPIGLPGLRWFDRSRTACGFPDYSRSYVGYQMSAVNDDLDATAPTVFELTGSSLGALSVITRGLPQHQRIGSITPRSALRAARTHFSGDLAGWLEIDRIAAGQITSRIRVEQPDFVFAALTGVDKVSHARGQDSPMTIDALRIVDETAAQIRDDAERSGRWDDMHLWIVSDHGHSRVRWHEDLAGLIDETGFRTMSHPWVVTLGAEVAVMVSGNAMAHLYCDVSSRTRPSADSPRWRALCDVLLARASVDLMAVRRGDRVVVRTADRGDAVLWHARDGYHYARENGDPLGIGRDVCAASSDESYDFTVDTDYPDSIVQLTNLVTSPRSGDIVLSAARDWDFRARYEPIRHVSSHGALHREHMLVPLLTNRPLAATPRRTVDVMPSALELLGAPVPAVLDGRSFVSRLAAIVA